MTKLIFFFFLVPTYSFCNTAVDGIKIFNDSFIKVVKNLNEVLAEKDTNKLTDSHCIEIVRVFNTIRFKARQPWSKDSSDKEIVSTFMNYVNITTDFGREIQYYIANNGDVTFTRGMGLFYAKFDIYSGLILNDKSLYDIIDN
jgi:hypothetical protein